MPASTSHMQDEIEREVLDAGSRRLYAKPWSELVKDFERIGKSPSANFTAAVLVAGALALLKKTPA